MGEFNRVASVSDFVVVAHVVVDDRVAVVNVVCVGVVGCFCSASS